MSQINWFPGHMHKARKEIAEVMGEIDLVIEVLDARLPRSSENPLVNQLRKGKPVLKLLNKQDLSDPVVTQHWLDFFNQHEDTRAIAMDQTQLKLIKRLPEICKQMVPARAQADRPIRAMIMGIPNVGKSTLLNAILGRKLAKVGNEPAVTRQQKKYTVQKGLALSDTPGILWPKIEDNDSGYRLAVSGAIKDTAIEHELVAGYAARFMLDRYAVQLQQRYRIESLPELADELLDTIGRKRGCLRAGGVVDRHKASEILINEMRSGKLGFISFETPEEWQLKDEAARQAALEAVSEDTGEKS